MKIKFIQLILLNLLFVSSLFSGEFKNDIQKLTSKKFKEKEQSIKELFINHVKHEKLEILFNSMLNNKLYFIKKDKTLVILLKKEGKNYHTKNLLNNENIEVLNKRLFKKIKTTNKLRSILRSKLALLYLYSKKSELRLLAAKNILKDPKQNHLKLVKKALIEEEDENTRDIFLEIINILNAKYLQGEEQYQAIINLGEFVSSKSLQTLKELQNAQNTQRLKSAIEASISSIESKKSVYAFIEKVFFGLSLGSILLLAAIGLSITFGVMKVINMAHGEMMMIGAYTTYTIQQLFPHLIEYSILFAIPLAFIVSGLVGIIIERLVIRHLYGRPLETLLATFGISLILQQIIRTIYSPLNQEVKTPSWMSGALEINEALSFTFNRLYIILFAILVFTAILLLLNKTSLGLKVKAVTQNRQMAQAMGIRTSYIDAMTFGLGSGIAGVAGVALSQITNVGPNLGQAYIVDSFMVVVFGGVGNLWGTLIAAISLGELNKFMEPYAGAVLTKVLILVFIILFIQKRPRGLFPQKGRDAQD